MRVKSVSLATAALLAASLAACEKTETKYITVPGEIPACSQTYPIGACPTGESCFQGACVATGTLCSASTPTGACRDGYACYGGGCILASAVPPVVPDPVDPCTVQVNSAQPTLRFAAAVPTDSNGAALGTAKTKVTVGGLDFRDLSSDGQLQKYEDWRYSPICRAKDLVTRMSIPQKIGLMSVANGLGAGTADGTLPAAVVTFLRDQHGRQALIRFGTVTANQLAAYTNKAQALAETQPLGIPIAITGDPAHFNTFSMGATGTQTLNVAPVFTPWPGPLALGAMNNTVLAQAYGDMVRREFMAVGVRWQLGPQVDLATDPRWERVPHTMGDQADPIGENAAAIVRGFQKSGDLVNGIASTPKHFPGHGAQEAGRDSHNINGKYLAYPGNAFLYHTIPFQYAFDEGAMALMPTYSALKGMPEWDAGLLPAAFSYNLVTKLAKDVMGFDGMVTGDWQTAGVWSWGLDSGTGAQKAKLFLEAGSHQFGLDPQSQFQDALDQGLVNADQIDAAAVKILELTFRLGLFENPYVDEAAASSKVRTVADRTLGFEAQKRSIVLLRNQDHSNASVRYLPISGTRTNVGAATYMCDANGDGTVRVYYDGVVDGIVADPAKPDVVQDVFGDYSYTSAAAAGAIPVAATGDLAQADIAIIRISGRGGYGVMRNIGALSVPLSFDGEIDPVVLSESGQADTTLGAALASKKKVLDALRARDGYKDSNGNTVAAVNPNLKIVLVVHVSRPPILRPFVQGLVSLDETTGVPGSYPSVSNPTNIRNNANGGVDAILAEFGALDRAILDFVFNKNVPAGVTYGQAKLPLEFPSSDAAVQNQLEDVPDDSEYPTFNVGSGITLPAN